MLPGHQGRSALPSLTVDTVCTKKTQSPAAVSWAFTLLVTFSSPVRRQAAPPFTVYITYQRHYRCNSMVSDTPGTEPQAATCPSLTNSPHGPTARHLHLHPDGTRHTGR
ncbi:hypothetical protein E2C01_040231 [Portunus trituberculatus]|uniref:Uncharacterized protein n=1 Tax=Portunus trituberculatus TaxID=210409 RepID=A0A5B7FGU9_PORTR|nr:hypothetical protein [Portunus trituberculatus]